MLLTARAEMALMARNATALPRAALRGTLPADRRLTVAFVSGHFADHPMMQMMQASPPPPLLHAAPSFPAAVVSARASPPSLVADVMS